MTHDLTPPREISARTGALALYPLLKRVGSLGESFAQGGMRRFSEALVETGIDLGLLFAEVTLQRDQQREVLASKGEPTPEVRSWRLASGNGELSLRGSTLHPQQLASLEALLGALQPWLGVILAAPPRPDPRGTAQRLALTRAQTRVLDLLLQGLSNKAIAERLRCSTKTVEAHTTRILRGAGVSSRSELLSRLFTSCDASEPDGRGALGLGVG